MDQNSSGGFPSLRHAETAVADFPTGWTHPLWVAQGLRQTFPVTVQQAGGTKLPPHSFAVFVVAHRLHVLGLLAALVTSGAVQSIVDFLGAARNDLDVARGWVGGDIVQFNWLLLGISANAWASVEKMN